MNFSFPKKVYMMTLIDLWSHGGELNHISKMKKIQTCNIKIMNSEYGSSVSFGSRVRSKYIGHNTYTGRRSNFRSKPTPIHGPFHK